MRDDFSETTKEVLAKRAGNRCSNPNCRKPTSGPRTDPAKAINIGVAAHITAASMGGPRYDPTLTSEQRKHPDNGIWLCQNCAKLVDNDAERYPADKLRKWKRRAEQDAFEELECRVPPNGITALDTITSLDLARYRESIINLYGTTQIFGQPRPVPLGDIYTDLYLLDTPSAARRFDITQIGQDPDLLDSADRVQGLALLHTDHGHRLFILGKPGAGKTTFLKHIALQAAKGNLERIPIFVTLKEWADSGDDLLAFITRQFAICGVPDATRFIAHLLQETDDALLLLDGLDEIQQEEGRRSRAISELLDFSRRYRRAQCLLTCRIAATDYTFERFSYVEVADFTADQSAAFVHKWFHATPATGEAFLEEIAREEHRGLRELARIPLLLAMLCLAFNDTLRFPMRRVEVYAEALDALLRKWDSSRGVQRDEVYRALSPGRKHQLFVRIAAQTFERGDYFLPQDSLEAQISSYFSQLPRVEVSDATETDSTAILKAIEAQHGIFVERAHRIYSFAHLSFQEYYTARHVVTNAARGTFPRLLAHCTDARWREVILLSASLLDEADPFFVDFRRAVDAVIEEDERIVALLRWAGDKSARAKAERRPAALRAFYCYLDLAVDLGVDLDQQFEGDLDFLLNLVLDSVFEMDSGFALDLALDMDRALSLAMAYGFDIEEAGDLDPDLAIDLALARSASAKGAQPEALDVSEKMGEDELHKTLSALSVPGAESTEQEAAAFTDALRLIMIDLRNIGHSWNLASEQLDLLGQYFRASLLLIQCLDVAMVSNRQAIEDSLLLPPGAWQLYDSA